MQRLVTALCLLLLTFTSTSQQAAAAPAPGSSICVASAIGHRFNVQTIGLMVFGNALQSTSASSWGIDDLVVNKVSALLRGRYTVRRANLPQAAIAAYESRKAGPFHDYNADLLEGVRAAARTVKCDFYLVATRATSTYANTNQGLTGLGVLKHDIGIISSHFVFASFILQLYDGKTFAIERYPFSAASLLGGDSPYHVMDKANWPATPQAAIQNATLRNMVRALVEKRVTNSVQSMFH